MRKIPFSDCRYLPPTIAEDAWGMTITTTGYQDIPPGIDYPSEKEHPAGYYFKQKAGRVLQEYQLIYVTRGKGTFCSRSAGTIYIRSGDVLMLFPGEWHVYTPDAKTGWAAYWVGFRGPYPDSLNNKGYFHKAAPIYNIGLHETVVSLFSQMLEYSRQESPASQQILAGGAIHLLSQVYAISQNVKYYDASEQIVAKAKVMMLQNIYQPFSPERLAESLNVSYSLFRSLFKQHTGTAPGRYQQQLRIQKAKELLMDASKTVKEISVMLNYESESYFSASFKRKTGDSPGSFRRKALKGDSL